MSKQTKRFEREVFDVLESLLSRIEVLEAREGDAAIIRQLFTRIEQMEDAMGRKDARIETLETDDLPAELNERLTRLENDVRYGKPTADTQPAPPDEPEAYLAYRNSAWQNGNAAMSIDLWRQLKHDASVRRVAELLSECAGECGADCDNTCGEVVPAAALDAMRYKERSFDNLYEWCYERGMRNVDGRNTRQDILAFLDNLWQQSQQQQTDPKNTYWVERATAAERSIREYQEGAKRDAAELAAKDTRIAGLESRIDEMSPLFEVLARLHREETWTEIAADIVRVSAEHELSFKLARQDGYNGNSLCEWAQMILQANKMEKTRGDRFEEAYEHLAQIVTGNRKLSPTGTEMCADRHKRVFDALYALDQAAPVNSRWAIQDGDLCCHAVGRQLSPSFSTPADALVNFLDNLPKPEEAQPTPYAETFDAVRKEQPE